MIFDIKNGLRKLKSPEFEVPDAMSIHKIQQFP